MTRDQLRTDHGVTVTLPGHQRAVVYTDSHEDSQVIADAIRHGGAFQASLFDVETPNTNGAFSR